MTTWEATTRRHGTVSGFLLHMELDERPCEPCYMARQEYDKRRRAAAAQAKAYGRLARLYPDVYRAFYEEELAALDVSVPARGVT